MDKKNAYIIGDTIVDLDQVERIKWVRHQDGSPCRIWLSDDCLKIVKLYLEDDEFAGYEYYIVPYENVSIEEEGSRVYIRFLSLRTVKLHGVDMAYPPEPDDLDNYALLKMAQEIFKDSKDKSFTEAHFSGFPTLE